MHYTVPGKRGAIEKVGELGWRLMGSLPTFGSIPVTGLAMLVLFGMGSLA